MNVAAMRARRRERLRLEKEGQPLVSTTLEAWLDSDEPTTIGSLSNAFGEKILAAACMALMAPSALPLPTGGATHAFAVIALIFAVQMVIGRKTLWLPQRWKAKELGSTSSKALRALIRFVKWCEKFSRPRMALTMRSRVGETVMGLVIVTFVMAAFFAPPFSGLDTLPALGVVFLCLGILLEDVVLAAIGSTIGVGGISLTITLGVKVTEFFSGLFD